MPGWSDAYPLTRGPKHHFFGYYGISPCNASDRLYACLESAFHDRMPQRGERATIGLVSLESTAGEAGAFEPLTTTAAWNLQQGAMIHWLPGAAETTLVFNDLDAGAGCFRPVVLDVPTGPRRTVPAPIGIGAVSPDGRSALGLDYARLHAQRPVVGYAGARDRTAGVLAPDDDGVWRIDLPSGQTDLLLSHAAALHTHPAPPLAHSSPLFFNHTLYNPDGSRFMVFLRYFTPQGALDSAVFTANQDGSDLRCLVPWGNEPSHFDWYSPTELMVTVSREGGGRRYLLITDSVEDGWRSPIELGIGGSMEVLTTEGHPTFTPDRRYFVFDGPSDAGGTRPLRLYDMADRRELEMGRFYAAPHFKGDVRCDLHPRWNRAGTQVTFDSVHEGERQVYAIDITFD